MSTSPTGTAEVLYRARAYDTPVDPFTDAGPPGELADAHGRDPSPKPTGW